MIAVLEAVVRVAAGLLVGVLVFCWVCAPGRRPRR